MMTRSHSRKVRPPFCLGPSPRPCVCVAGDKIVDVNVIDDGWVEGRVVRTGKFGMLPSNYIEKQ